MRLKVQASSNGNIMKIPEKDASLLYQEVDEGVAGEDLRILEVCVVETAKKRPASFQPTHHLDDPVKMAFPSPASVSSLSPRAEWQGQRLPRATNRSTIFSSIRVAFV